MYILISINILSPVIFVDEVSSQAIICEHTKLRLEEKVTKNL